MSIKLDRLSEVYSTLGPTKHLNDHIACDLFFRKKNLPSNLAGNITVARFYFGGEKFHVSRSIFRCGRKTSHRKWERMSKVLLNTYTRQVIAVLLYTGNISLRKRHSKMDLMHFFQSSFMLRRSASEFSRCNTLVSIFFDCFSFLSSAFSRLSNGSISRSKCTLHSFSSIWKALKKKVLERWESWNHLKNDNLLKYNEY